MSPQLRVLRIWVLIGPNCGTRVFQLRVYLSYRWPVSDFTQTAGSVWRHWQQKSVFEWKPAEDLVSDSAGSVSMFFFSSCLSVRFLRLYISLEDLEILRSKSLTGRVCQTSRSLTFIPSSSNSGARPDPLPHSAGVWRGLEGKGNTHLHGWCTNCVLGAAGVISAYVVVIGSIIWSNIAAADVSSPQMKVLTHI